MTVKELKELLNDVDEHYDLIFGYLDDDETCLYYFDGTREIVLLTESS